MRRTKSCRKMYKHIQWTRFIKKKKKKKKKSQRFRLFLNSSAMDIVLVTLPSTAVETAVAQCTSRCAMARGHRLDTSILAAVHGLSGLFRAVSRSSLHSFVLYSPLPPPPSPSLISHHASVDVKQNVLDKWNFVRHPPPPPPVRLCCLMSSDVG